MLVARRTEIECTEDKVSPYLLTEPRILLDVCRALQHDDGGRSCPTCCVREFCDKQARRAGRER